jgi:two-component system sensor histidine kinase KdpD
MARNERPTEPRRPEPEALLADANRDGRGRLKVYLGMAPGVGKTFAMLESAQRLRTQGTDVVVGIVETHGRAETQTLLDGLEMLPRRSVSYRGHELHELDLDAALRRRPKVLLVDELAHTNAPECRHSKRWQDVEELLRAGIDVHTTVNIQHIEGLNDIVARITGVRVRETLPDQVLENADDIALIDITPAELITRLEEGKVYVAELAGRARESFFTPGNLTALRELALRRTAERVDAQMVGYMRRHAIEGPWAAGERVLVCVGTDGQGSMLVRAAHRTAEQLRAPWFVMHVETMTSAPSDDATRQLDEDLALAERLGGRIERLAASDPVDAILTWARRSNITQLFVGHSRRGRLRVWPRPSVAQRMVDEANGIAVHVVTPGNEKKTKTRLTPPGRAATLADVAASVVSVAAVLAIVLAVPGVRSQPNVAMLFLAAVLFAAVSRGLASALVTAVVAFLSYNFFFTEPYLTFRVSHWHDVITLFVFVTVAGTTGTLAGRVRDQANAARARMTALETLYDFARRLGAAKTWDDLLHAVVLRAYRMSGRSAMMLLPENGDLQIRYSWPPEYSLDDAAYAAARWALEHNEPAGAETDTMPRVAWHFRPMRAATGAKGVFGIRRDARTLPRDFLATLDAMLDQAVVAIERIAFASEASHVEAAAETERLRAALLASISHDLRTPLTSILGSVTALRQEGTTYDESARADLLATIQEETERLDRFVANLLEITRLEAGALEVKRDWLVVSEVVDSATRALRRPLESRRVVRRIDPDLPLVCADFVLLETVLVNLLDNAVKHARDATTIEIDVTATADALRISVTDDGDGIPEAYVPQLFDRFLRMRRSDTVGAGTGLGLSICKGLVEAMGGTIEVESPVAAARGSRFTLIFPLEAQPADTRAVEDSR